MKPIRHLLLRVLRWPAVLGWMALIFAGSSVPAEIITATPQRVPIDKVAHFGEYSVLAFLLVGVARRRTRGQRITPLLLACCIAFATAYGASDEFHQRFVRGRDAALDDLAADAIGSTAGALVAAVVLTRIDRAETRAVRRGGSASGRRAP